MNPNLPERIGPYRLEAPLASAPSGTVWLALDARRRRVAFKLHDDAAQARAEMELLGLRHPGLAACLDANLLPGTARPYTVTEYVDGVSLGPGALDVTSVDATALAARLLGAVAFLHDEGLLHRDIKSDNIWLESGSGLPVMLDFGLACPLDLAATRALAGTPRCLAPELLEGGSASVASDLWAVGLLLAEALLGRRLLNAVEPQAMLDERRALDGLSAADKAALGHPGLATLLHALLQADPGRRPRGAHEALALLLGSGREALQAELQAAALEGRLTSALARQDDVRTARLAAVQSGRLWLQPFEAPETGLSQALGALCDLGRAVDAAPESLRARLAAADTRVAAPGVPDLVALVEALAEVSPLAIECDVGQALDEAGRAERAAVAAALGALRGVELRPSPAPDGPACVDVLRDWLGPQPVLEARLEATPPRHRAELAGALFALLRSGTVSAGPEGVGVHEDRLPAAWPLLSEGELTALVAGRDRELLGLLGLCPRPLTVAGCGRVLGRDVRDELERLRADGLVRRERSHPTDVYSPADARLRRLLVAQMPVGAETRRALAREIAADAGCLSRTGRPAHAAAPMSMDVATAASLAEVLAGPAPGAPDDDEIGALLLAAAEELRRVGRLDRAAALLQRAALGAAAAAPERRRIWLDLIDVLTRAARYDEALTAAADARARLPGDQAVAQREARVQLLRGRPDEALALLADVDLDGLSDQDAALCLETRSDTLDRLGRSAEALTAVREALRRFGRRPHRRSVMLMARIGNLEHKAGRPEQAVQQLEEAIALARQIGHDALVGPMLSNLGRIVRTKGERRRGLAIQEEAAQLMQASGFTPGLAFALNGLGIGWLELGRMDTARRHLQRALSLAERLGDASLAAMVHNNLGRALAGEGRHDEAEAEFARSIALREERQDLRGLAVVLLTRAHWRLARGRTDAASHDLARAAECLADVDVPEHRVPLSLQNARLALGRGEGAAAVAEARGARDHAERAGLRAEWLTARNLMGQGGGVAEDDLEDVDADAEERSPTLADLLFTRAVLREGQGRGQLADQDFELALTLLGETPDGPIEARGLVARLELDLVRLQTALARPTPDFGEVGELLSRLTRDTDRAGVLVAMHGLAPLHDRLVRLQQIQAKMEHQGEDMSALARLAERVRNLERLAEVNKALNSTREAQTLLELIVDSAIEITGAARGFLILFDGRAEEFRAARNIDESTIHNPEFEVSHSVARQVMKSQRPLITANAIDDERLASARSISELKLLSILCVPLVAKDRGLGAIYLDHPQVVGRFGEHHLEAVTTLAEQAAIALENARLSEGLTSSNEELRMSQEEIARLNDALQERLHQREAELEEVRESLDVSRRALGLRYDYSKIVTRSPRMHAVLDLMDRVIDTDYPVIIQGESGTGKELIASAIHFNGPRKQKNFVSLNCAAIPEHLIESELFGHVRGAFTGADRDRKGLFEQADGGTLFLDEIGDMSLDVQKRLLRVLQEGEFLPVGGREVRRVNVRVLAATHRDLRQMVSEGRFREDLFFRLAVAQIHLPPLRDRAEDLPLLVDHFVQLHGGGPRSLDPEALRLLERESWPGNIRELSNLVMNLLLFDREGARIAPQLVRRVLHGGAAGAEEPESDLDGLDDLGEAGDGAASLKDRLEAFERRAVEQALEAEGGNKAAAARRLGVGTRTFYKMLSRLGLA